ncbi:MAG: DegT/DnrJ/EryC1/StrS family aminotransferase [Candidatus Glassbacteria bacterium]
MFTRIPSIGTPIDAASILRGLGAGDTGPKFRRLLCEMTGRRYCALTGSGTTALYLILRSLKRLCLKDRCEVLMPAYTAPSLVLAMREAGALPVLTEVSITTFNQDLDAMKAAMCERTLAAMPVHMYGLIEDISNLEESASRAGVFVIEDAASAMGSSVGGRPAGSMGDVSFFSFNRGKNISTVRGGAVLTDREDIFEAVAEEQEKLRSPNGVMKLHTILKAVGLSLVWRPQFYSLLWPIACRYKYRGLHEDIELISYTEFQSGLGCSLMERREEIFSKRHENGTFLYDSLRGYEHVTTPSVAAGSYPVYNQFPILVQSPLREEMIDRLTGVGLGVTTLYPLPIHRIYELGHCESPDPFPGASRLAREILLLPVHPGVSTLDLAQAVKIVTDRSWTRRDTTDTAEEHKKVTLQVDV